MDRNLGRRGVSSFRDNDATGEDGGVCLGGDVGVEHRGVDVTGVESFKRLSHCGWKPDPMDAAVVIDQLGSAPVVVLGHSLGGITAYQLAAQHPDLVRALVIEDIGAVVRQPEVSHPVLDVRNWPRYASTREELAEAIRARGVLEADYFLLSAVVDEQGWRLLFDYEEMMTV